MMDLAYYKNNVNNCSKTLEYLVRLQDNMGWIARIFQGRMMSDAVGRAGQSLSQAEKKLAIQIKYPDTKEGNLRRDIDDHKESIVQINDNIKNYSDVLDQYQVDSYKEMIVDKTRRIKKWEKQLSELTPVKDYYDFKQRVGGEILGVGKRKDV